LPPSPAAAPYRASGLVRWRKAVVRGKLGLDWWTGDVIGRDVTNKILPVDTCATAAAFILRRLPDTRFLKEAIRAPGAIDETYFRITPKAANR